MSAVQGRRLLWWGLAMSVGMASGYADEAAPSPEAPPVRIGYFHGGRTMLLYRAYINHEFEREQVPVTLVTKRLYDTEWSVVPERYEDIRHLDLYGKATGTELLEEVARGALAGATAGQSSFIDAVERGWPVVAVAELGHDLKSQPDHAIIFRKDVVIRTPADLQGKILVSRRAGEGDAVFLREFVRSVGLDPERDVVIRDQVMDDEVSRGIIDGTIDGGFYHLMALEKLVKRGDAYVYRRFDWVNPELSQALLVFHRDMVRDHPDQVERIVLAYMKRILFEHGLSKSERIGDPDARGQKGLQMEKDFQGMNLPQYDFPPQVSLELLQQMQGLLLTYHYAERRVDLAPFVDNRFVERVYEELR